jgi:hypothetical protein
MCPSYGAWLLKAAHPVDPVKGNPANPASGKTSPHLYWNNDVISSFGSSWLISSGQELSAKRVLSSDNPSSYNFSWMRASHSIPLIAPGKKVSIAFKALGVPGNM